MAHHKRSGSKEEQVNVIQKKILWILYNRFKGIATLRELMCESRMCLGMLLNNLSTLIEMGLVEQKGDDTYALTRRGKSIAKKIM